MSATTIDGVAAVSAPSWVDHSLDALAGAGYRRGGARTAVVEVLGRQACAVSALEIEDALRAEDRTVARASVYRVLEQLEALRLVTRVEVGQGTARFEPVQPGGDHHHHMVCQSCGSVTPFEDRDLERAIARLSRRVSFDVGDHDVVLHGRCRTCAA